MPKISFVLLSAAVLLASAGLAPAANSVVGNASFETPDTTAGPNFTAQFPQDVAGVSSAWEQFGNGYKGVYVTAHFGGLLTNAAGSSGISGPQAATLSAGTAGGGLLPGGQQQLRRD